MLPFVGHFQLLLLRSKLLLEPENREESKLLHFEFGLEHV
jgi:hypothetical protein